MISHMHFERGIRLRLGPLRSSARGVEIVGEPVWMKEKHVRFRVRQGDKTLQLKAWNLLDRAAELTAGARIDVVFELEEDRNSLSRGYSGWSAKLRDMRSADL